MRNLIRGIGHGFSNFVVGVSIAVLIAGGVAFATNYTVTQGTGLTFGSIVVAGTNYAQQFICDLTTPGQCAAVSAAGAVKVDGSAVTQPVSGSVSLTGATNNIQNITGTVSLPTGAATAALQNPVNVTPADCSGTITAGGSAQNAIAAGATLHGFFIANIDSTAGSGEPLWVSFTTTAAASTAASYALAAPTATTFAGMSSFTSPVGFATNANVSVIGATTGHKFSCTKW